MRQSLKKWQKALKEQDWRCTMFPNGIWKKCCISHDYGCAHANFKQDPKERLKADRKLRNCANKTFPFVGEIMYIGVRGFNFWKKVRGKNQF